MRTMSRTTAALGAGALLLIVLGTAPTSADSTHFSTKFFNKSAATMKVEILHTDGSLQKSETVKPGDHHTFWFGSKKCNDTKTRRFRIYERVNNTVIATGFFSMKTGPAVFGGCNDSKIEFKWIECVDTPNDRFTVRCSVNDDVYQSARGLIHVTSNTGS